MKFNVERTSMWNNKKPCDEAYQIEVTRLAWRTWKSIEDALSYDAGRQWYDSGINHRVENGMVVCERKENEKIWIIDIDSLDELKKFLTKYGECVISTERDFIGIDYSIEIYDGYRE